MRKIIAVLCCFVCMLALPLSSLAADEAAIQLGTDGVGVGDKVYFGKHKENSVDYDVPWIVLPKTLSEADTETANALPLLSEYMLGNSKFEASGSGFYKDSTLNARMDGLYNAGTNTLFTLNERLAIAAVTNLICWDENLPADSPAVPTAYLFPLSLYDTDMLLGWDSAVLQAKQRSAPNSVNADTWWLRTSLVGDRAFITEWSGECAVRMVNVG